MPTVFPRPGTALFAGRKRTELAKLELLAMQKVEGSSPFSRLEVPANWRFSGFEIVV
jgi:hypothetical protein